MSLYIPPNGANADLNLNELPYTPPAGSATDLDIQSDILVARTFTAPYQLEQAETLVVLNNADIGTNLLISQGDLTLSKNVGAFEWSSVRATLSRNSGKFYFEIINANTVHDFGTGNAIIGLMTGAESLEFWPGMNPGEGVGFWMNNANGVQCWKNGASVGNVTPGVPYCRQGQIAMVAIDFDAGKVWFGNDGIWGGNPAAGTGEAQTFTPGTELFPGLAIYRASQQLRANFGATPFFNKAPSGFLAWNGATATHQMVMNEYAMGNQLALSASKLRITKPGGGYDWQTVRSTTSIRSGKVYFEVANILNTDHFCSVGICSSDASFDTYIGSTSGTVSIGLQINRASHPRSYSASIPKDYPSLADCATGQTAMIAVDIDAGKIWFGVNGTWDGDPAAGTGEAHTFTAGAVIYPAVSIYGLPQESEANLGATAFAHTIPSGFVAANADPIGIDVKTFTLPYSLAQMVLNTKTFALPYSLVQIQENIRTFTLPYSLGQTVASSREFNLPYDLGNVEVSINAFGLPYSLGQINSTSKIFTLPFSLEEMQITSGTFSISYSLEQIQLYSGVFTFPYSLNQIQSDSKIFELSYLLYGDEIAHPFSLPYQLSQLSSLSDTYSLLYELSQITSISHDFSLPYEMAQVDGTIRAFSFNYQLYGDPIDYSFTLPYGISQLSTVTRSFSLPYEASQVTTAIREFELNYELLYVGRRLFTLRSSIEAIDGRMFTARYLISIGATSTRQFALRYNICQIQDGLYDFDLNYGIARYQMLSHPFRFPYSAASIANSSRRFAFRYNIPEPLIIQSTRSFRANYRISGIISKQHRFIGRYQFEGISGGQTRIPLIAQYYLSLIHPTSISGTQFISNTNGTTDFSITLPVRSEIVSGGQFIADNGGRFVKYIGRINVASGIPGEYAVSRIAVGPDYQYTITLFNIDPESTISVIPLTATGDYIDGAWYSHIRDVDDFSVSGLHTAKLSFNRSVQDLCFFNRDISLSRRRCYVGNATDLEEILNFEAYIPSPPLIRRVRTFEHPYSLETLYLNSMHFRIRYSVEGDSSLDTPYPFDPDMPFELPSMVIAGTTYSDTEKGQPLYSYVPDNYSESIATSQGHDIKI